MLLRGISVMVMNLGLYNLVSKLPKSFILITLWWSRILQLLLISSAVMILICILWELCFRIANPLCFPSLAVCFLTSIEKEIWLPMVWPREALIKLAWGLCKLPSMPSFVYQEVLDDMNGLVRPRASCCCSWCFKNLVVVNSNFSVLMPGQQHPA